MSMSISVILGELSSSPKSIIPILYSLYHDRSILGNISKSDLKHMASRALVLSRSGNDYDKWCGNNLIKVLSSDYSILAEEGTAFIGQLMKSLQNYNERSDLKVLTSAIESLNFLADQIRGKPTLTWEILTPNLSTIISLYLERLHWHPYLIIKSLLHLIRKHPTTFRPFGNKFRSRLLELSSSNDFNTFPSTLRSIIYEALSELTSIEKNDPNLKWGENVFNLLKELNSVLSIYGEFLNISGDEYLQGLIKKLPSYAENENTRLLPSLSIDINLPITFFQISARIEVLLKMIESYLLSETQYSVKVPLGLTLVAIETVCSINTRLLHFKKDIIQDTIRTSIKATISRNQIISLQVLNGLAKEYKGSVLLHYSNVISFLETIIPFKGKTLDNEIVISNEELYCELLNTIQTLLILASSVNDSLQIARFVDLALCLVDKRTIQKDVVQSSKPGKNTNKKQKKSKNSSAVPLSDLLSHSHLFQSSVPKKTITTVRRFISATMRTVILPPTQHYKVLRYLLVESNRLKYFNLEKRVPKELSELLLNTVLFPGFEKISILPMVGNTLQHNALLSIFYKPRFPPLPVLLKKQNQIFNPEKDETEDEEEAAQDANEQLDLRRDANKDVNELKRDIQGIMEDKEVSESFSKRHKSDFESTKLSCKTEEAPLDLKSKFSIPTLPFAKPFTQNKQDLGIENTSLDSSEQKSSQKFTNTFPLQQPVQSTISNEKVSSVLQADDDKESDDNLEVPEIDLGDDSDDD